MSLCKTRDRFHLGMDLELLGLSVWNSWVYQSGNLRVSTNVLFNIPKGICDGCSLAFNGRRASILVIEQIPEEVADVSYRGTPEVHLFFCAPMLENGLLGCVDGSC